MNKGALDTSLSIDEQNKGEVMFVYVDVNSGAVKAIIPSIELSVNNPADFEAFNRTAENR